ncbi:hypothetical protein HID58_051635 [Brassica napus]|uniref:Uncharacterized protein n=1 Tax=Brassica napus TaxID=3708 RepID=A0ABQ8AAQ7_BRANA|nr:hypothetical protein HID58_051635 [Brassica napus]
MSELQKPKSKREEEEEEANNNVGCREEQEQALVALVEHRSAEIDRLKHHISNYQTKLIEAQRSLRDSKAKLSNLRGHDESARNVTPSRKDSYPSPSPSKILKPSVPTSSISKSKTNTVVVKQKPETSSSRDGFSNSKTKTVVVKQKPETSSSRDSRNSSPTTIKCHSSNQISSQHKRKLRSLILCPVNEQLFATSSLDGMVSLWQLQPGRNMCKLMVLDKNDAVATFFRLSASLLSTTDCLSQKQRRWGEDMAWHPSGHALFSVYTADDGDSQISILNLNKTRGQDSSESQSALINQSWSPDGLHITSGSADPVIHVFDIRYNARKPTQSIKAHQKRVFKAEWHYSQPLLISISSDLNIGLHKIS